MSASRSSGPGYRLASGDYQARVSLGEGRSEDCTGMTLSEAHTWQWAAETRGREAWKGLEDRERALVLRAHDLRLKAQGGRYCRARKARG